MRLNFYHFVFVGVLLIGLSYLGYTSNWQLQSCKTQQTDDVRAEEQHEDLELQNGTEEEHNDLELPPGREEQHKDLGLHSLPGLVYTQPSALNGRSDVAYMTPWLAPIVWEGTFNPTLIDSIYKQQNITIATTVFALGKYTRFFRDFLESAEQHYFVGFRVHYYLFTDQPEAVPDVKLGNERQLRVRTVPRMDRWQDISMGRMGMVAKLTESELVNEAGYIFCLDVDTKFYARWSVEALGSLVGVIHPWFYNYRRDQFTYERRPESQAVL